MAQKARLAYGTLEGVDAAIERGTLDSYDVLFLKNSEGKPFVGWIDKNGNKVIVENENKLLRVSSLPTEGGDAEAIYLYNNEGYIWDADTLKCVPLAKSANLTELETEIASKVDETIVDDKITAAIADKVDESTVDSKISTAIADKVDEATVDSKISTAIADMNTIEIVEF